MEKLRAGDPEKIGPYNLIARLGAGGMGVVFLGTKGVDRFAIKVVRSSFLDDPTLRTRFVREIETLKKVSSPYVARILDSSVEGELAWHAVEFVNGPTLRELVDSKGPLSNTDWDTFADQLRNALESIHGLGIVHRDIKPSNIIMSETGPKLIDFGISQDSEATSLTSTGMVAGSPAWLSPEQLEGTEITSASDLFSAGSVLTFAATGRSPWGQETSLSVPIVYNKILSATVDLSGLTPSQQSVVEGLLDQKPENRGFGELDSNRTVVEMPARPLQYEMSEQLRPETSSNGRRAVAWISAATALILATGGAIWWLSGAQSTSLEAEETPRKSAEVDDSQSEASSWTECGTGLPLIERIEANKLAGATADSISSNMTEFDAVLGGSAIVVSSGSPNQPKYAIYMLRGFERSLLTEPKSSWSAQEFSDAIDRHNANFFIDLFKNECAGYASVAVSPEEAAEPNIEISYQDFIDSGKCEEVLEMFADIESTLQRRAGEGVRLDDPTYFTLKGISVRIRDVARELPDRSELKSSIYKAAGPFASAFAFDRRTADYYLSIVEPPLQEIKSTCG